MIELFAERDFWTPREIADKLGFADARPVNDAINAGVLRALEVARNHRRVPRTWVVEWLGALEIETRNPTGVATGAGVPVQRPRQRRRVSSKVVPRGRVRGLQHLVEQR